MKILVLPGGAWEDADVTGLHLKNITYNFPLRYQLFAVVQSAHNIQNTSRLKIIPIKVNRLPRQFIISQIALLHLIISSLFTALRVCKNEHIDVIYVRHGISSIPAIILNKILNIPFILEVNGILYEYEEIKVALNPPSVMIFPLRVLVHVIEKCAFKNATSMVIFTSGPLKDKIQKKYKISPEIMICVHNGVDVEVFKPIDKKLAQNRLKLNSGYKYVVFTGTLIKGQGLNCLIDAAPEVLSHCPNTRFLIVGDGLEQDELLSKVVDLGIKNNFIFAGRIPNKDVAWYINAADICVAPYDSDRVRGMSPLKFFEYMACGKPIISTNIQGIENYIRDTNCGIIVQAGDQYALGKAIISLLKNESLRDNMGRNGREAAVTKYSWKSVTEQIAQVCEKIVNQTF